MASDITLSKGVRSNLLSLQNTAELLNRTQERLASGKKVNSALDNPINFFTSSGLSARANDLSRLLDSVGNAVQTLQAADKGISSIQKLIESAGATARQALTAADPVTTYTPFADIDGNVDVTADVAAAATGNVDLDAPVDLGATLDGETITVTVNGVDTVLTINTTTLSHADELATALDGISGIAAELDGTTGFLEITADDNTTSFSLAYSDAAVGTAIGIAAGDFDPTNSTIDALTGTITFTLAGTAAQTVDFDTIANRQDLEARLATISAAMSGITVSIDGTTGFIGVTSTNTTSATLTIAESSGAATALGLATGVSTPTAVVTPNETRASLQADFNLLLTQITQLAADASFNGVNLLDGDDLTVTFNEDGTSSLLIEGVDFSATGLGIDALTGTAFQTDAGVNAAITDLDAATATLRTQASKFGSNLSIVQTRQDFTKNLISVLQIGADNLVLADTNEEGANMLALNTRQQLSTVALSLAAQADQNVLQLF
jgi:flagellin-like hook-associated protein FlgL